MAKNVPWSVEDRAKVSANYGHNMTAGELGKMLGRTTLAVWREACRQGITNQGKQFIPPADVCGWPPSPLREFRALGIRL